MHVEGEALRVRCSMRLQYKERILSPITLINFFFYPDENICITTWKAMVKIMYIQML